MYLPLKSVPFESDPIYLWTLFTFAIYLLTLFTFTAVTLFTAEPYPLLTKTRVLAREQVKKHGHPKKMR